jgi:hypothetical protein
MMTTVVAKELPEVNSGKSGWFSKIADKIKSIKVRKIEKKEAVEKVEKVEKKNFI